MQFDSWILSGRRYREQQAELRKQIDEKPWLQLFDDGDPSELRCGSLVSPCRLEPIPFEHCFVDRFFFLSAPGEDLLGSALTMRIAWNGHAEDLPEGWEGAVRRCYRDCTDRDGTRCNTLVGMLVFTLPPYRNSGLASQFLDAMVELSQRLRYRWLVVPALPPSQFDRALAHLPFEELAMRKRPDGLPADHWLRLHVRKGAEIVKCSTRSHRFVLSRADFGRYMSSAPLREPGHHIVALDKDVSFGRAAPDTWQRVHVDAAHDVVSFSWGCVWVRYDVDAVPAGFR